MQGKKYNSSGRGTGGRQVFFSVVSSSLQWSVFAYSLTHPGQINNIIDWLVSIPLININHADKTDMGMEYGMDDQLEIWHTCKDMAIWGNKAPPIVAGGVYGGKHLQESFHSAVSTGTCQQARISVRNSMLLMKANESHLDYAYVACNQTASGSEKAHNIWLL